MNVLSLFDGISCAMVALERAGIKVDNYYASEVDKYAIEISKKNYPNIKHLGCVKEIDTQKLLKIDLLIGGSPCQGFSFAGKQLNFRDDRSRLFFEYVRILKELNPKYFLLENVKMKKEYQKIISDLLGVEPIEINSSLVSAQNRKRLYWTNIPNVDQPEDREIFLKDIIEKGIVDKEKSYCIDANYFKGGNLKSYFEKHRRQLVFSKDNLCHVGDADIKGNDSIKRVYHQDGKSPTLTTMGGGHREPKILCGAFRGRYIVDGKRQDGKMKTAGLTTQRLELRQDEKTNTLTTVQKDNVLCLKMREKSKTVRSGGRGSYDRHEWDSIDEYHWRKLTPLECERLQTLPDNYTKGISNTQRYKALGNGFTIEVIAHIFKGIK